MSTGQESYPSHTERNNYSLSNVIVTTALIGGMGFLDFSCGPKNIAMMNQKLKLAIILVISILASNLPGT